MLSMNCSSQVFNMDCMIGMAAYPDAFFDLACCDIPYGIGVGNMAYLNEIRTRTKQKNGSRLNANAKKEIYTLKDWDKQPPTQQYFNELKRISKHQIVFGIDYTNWTGVGSGRIIWNKGVPKGMGFKKYEIAYCSLIDVEIELMLLWSGMRQAKSLADPMTQQGNKSLNEKRIHPCHKPILLYQKLFLDYGFKGMKIIDTHLGGGSSRIAAHKMNYDFIGFETDKEYFYKQEERFKNYTSQMRCDWKD